jgi:hypothetical protein
MASHHSVVAIRPRSLAAVLADLKEARRDFDDALADIERYAPGWHRATAIDRADEAETRLDDLRAEFDARLIDTTGLTLNALMSARESALI